MLTKVLLLCTSSIIAALLLQTLLFGRTSAQAIYQQTKTANTHLLQSMRDDVAAVINDVEGGLITVYNQTGLMDDLYMHQELDVMKQRNFRAAYNLAQSFGADDKVAAVYIYDDFNRAISAYRHAETPVYSYPEDIFDDVAAYNAKPLRRFMNKEEKTMLISGYYNASRKKTLVRFALNIFSMDSAQNQIGCVVCDVDSDVFTRLLEKYGYGEDNLIWMQPPGDMVISTAGSAGEKYTRQLEALSGFVRLGDMEALEGALGDSVLFRLSIEKPALELFSLMPPSLLIKNQKTLGNNLLLIAAGLLALFAVISAVFARSITSPVRVLSNTMRRIQAGDTKLRVPDIGGGEIGELGGTFNSMLDKTEEMLTREYQASLQIQKARCNALQAQINPHFLYNTLDTMSSIALVQGCDTVGALCESLSGIFRYTLDTQHPLATLEQELHHLKNYLYVMDVRMHNQVSYAYDLQNEALLCRVPRLTLQPIVENAINHGVRGKKDDKRISIAAKTTGDLLEITVSDNGAGIEDAEALNKKLAECEEPDGAGSIGLANINARIKLLFGAEYGVHVSSALGEGTRVMVNIPVKEGGA